MTRKQIPILYESSAKVFTELKRKRGSLRQIIEKLEVHPKVSKAIFALSTKVLKNISAIRKVIESTDLKKKVNCDSALLEVLVGEILLGQFLRGRSNRIIRKVLNNKKKLVREFESLPKCEPEVASLPLKYLRVNLLKASMDEVVGILESNGYTYKNVENCSSFEEFFEIIDDIEEKTFVKDFHFPNELLVVNVKDTADIISSDAYKDGKMIYFDKASLMAVEMLRIKKGMTVLDVCGAPGTKTAAIASRCENDLKIISVDKNPQRCEKMGQLLSDLGVTCVDIRCADFLDENTVIEVNPDVVLLDPSCSGSGMFDRLDYDKESDETRRYLKLASFQTKMLCKVMALNPKRIVYSTCSTNVIENEFVIKRALEEAENGKDYELVKALPSWPKRGEEEHNHCIRSDETCRTRGFFAASLKRKERIKNEFISD